VGEGRREDNLHFAQHAAVLYFTDRRSCQCTALSQIAVQKWNQFFEVRLIDKQPWSLNYISRNGLLLLCSGLA
jgi:hypothetical protein